MNHALTVLVLHHTRKAGADDFLDLVSGTHGLTGAADQTMVLKRDRGTGRADAELFITGRDVEETTLALRFDSETCSWLLMGEAQEYGRSKEQQEILDLLRGRDAGMTPKDIAEEIGKNPNTVRSLLRRMVAAGRLQANADGKYVPI